MALKIENSLLKTCKDKKLNLQWRFYRRKNIIDHEDQGGEYHSIAGDRCAAHHRVAVTGRPRKTEEDAIVTTTHTGKKNLPEYVDDFIKGCKVVNSWSESTVRMVRTFTCPNG